MYSGERRKATLHSMQRHALVFMMLLRYILWGLLMGGALEAVEMYAQPSYRLSGYLRDREDSAAIAYAHAFVSSGSSFAVTDTTGFFSLSVALGDTVLFSAIQYEPRGMLIRKPPSVVPVTLFMRVRIYELSEVRVYARDPMQGFFSHLRIDYSAYKPRRFRPIEPRMGWGGGSDPNALGLLTMEGLLSSLLQPLSTEYRQMKKLYELRRKEQWARYYENLLTGRLSVNFVQAHIPLREEEIPDFLAFWKPEALLLEMASEYGLTKAIQEAKIQYIAHLFRLHSYRSYQDRVSTLELRALLWSMETSSPSVPYER